MWIYKISKFLNYREIKKNKIKKINVRICILFIELIYLEFKRMNKDFC